MSPSSTRDGVPAKILIVDDSPEDRTAARVFLSEAGHGEGLRFQFTESGKGEDGLSAYRSERPDLILLDYHLPDMDGLEFLLRLRAKSGEIPLPVVLFTGWADRSLASAALRAGAQDYLPKRFMAPEMLLRAVQSAQNRFMLQAERRRIERELAEIAERLRLTQEAVQIGTWDWEVGVDMLRWSPENFTLHGMAPAFGSVRLVVWLAAIHPDDRNRATAAVMGAISSGESFEIEYRVVLPDGGIRWLVGRGLFAPEDADRPSRLLGVSLDITARRGIADELARMNGELEQRVGERTAALVAENRRRLDAEALLHQTRKMEAIGQFTGVISHDFNNFLHAVIGNIDLAQQVVDKASQAMGAVSTEATTALRRALGNAMEAANSASQLTQRLLTFGRRQTLEPIALSVHHVIADLVAMIEQTIGKTIVIETRFAEGLWPIFADASQLQAALLNLIVNARDAMPLGGRLIIEACNTKMNEDDSLLKDVVMRGQYVLLSFTDNGSGIPKDVLARIFEPFFTTKAVGHGTGLGLPMVYGFVKQSGGHVRVTSDVGVGTTLKVYLPGPSQIQSICPS